MKRIGYQPTKLKTQFVILMGKLDGGSLGWCIPDSLTRDGGTIRAGEAELGFKVLGASGRTAVPSLAKLCGELTDFAAAQRPLRALASIGPDAFDAIIGIMTNQQSPCRSEAIFMTESLETNVSRAAPALLNNLQHSDDDIAYASLLALRKIVPPSEATLLALSNFLSPARFTLSPRACAARLLRRPPGWT